MRELRTGDIVLHKPSGEEWLVAWADHTNGYMAPCGWPTCQAQIADCEIISQADDERCKALARDLAGSGRSDAGRALALLRAKEDSA